MDKAFVNKVQQIILNHIEDEKLNVNILSFEIGLSRSQVWRKVKALTGKSVSQFICEVRLKEAAKLIQKDEFTAAEIAYKVGFNSPSYFHKCFHDHFGVTPGDYKTEKEESDNLILKTDESNKVEQQSSKSKKFILYSLLGLLIISFSFYYYTDYINKTTLFNKKSNKIAIAILPFKDLSSESDTQWFCDGITDNILLHLSPLKKLLVISNTSSGNYKGTDKKIPEIMKELDVDYILEGSVTKHNNIVKIIAQLINKNDEHIWSKEYIDSFDDIFAIQQNVSKEIAKKLIETLSPEEEKSIGKNLTDNKEAYQLYLKAISLEEIQTKEDVEMSIKLYQQAIDLDSNFTAAYARMAGRYYVLAYLNVKTYKEVKDKINNLLKKALEINPNSAMVYMEKGSIDRYEFNNWKSAGENFKKALELDPNDPWSHFYYGIYLKKKPIPDIKNYLKHLRIAQRLEPLSIYINNGLFYALLDNDKIIEAEEFYNKTGFVIRKKNNKIYREVQLNVYKNKDWMEAIRLYEKELKKDPNSAFLCRILGREYDGILNDDINAIEYAKKAYILDSANRFNLGIYIEKLVEG
ncbi:MAG: helix-turn-helix domain-containing protein, partial [Flavobacteriaceae bacterium]|nr:helix-turn-helix domain-containing protein [Flavobacteriaceae bacterium]